MNTQYYPQLCACGCEGKIKIKEYHKYYGIPKYLNNHGGFKGYKHTEEAKQKNREAHLGKNFSKEINKKKGRKGEKNVLFGKKRTEEQKSKQSKIMKGRKTPEEVRIKQSKASKGKRKTEEHRRNISEGLKGEKNYNWQGGISFLPYAPEFNKKLKQFILERDNYICQCPDCKHLSERLEIHHIDYDKKNNNSDNLITLCGSCHGKTKAAKNRVLWAEFYQNIMMGKVIECLL